MTVNRAWVERLETIEAAIERGETSVQKVLNPPRLKTIDEVRAEIAANPPLEGDFVAKRLFNSSGFFVCLWSLSSIVAFSCSIILEAIKGTLSTATVIGSAIAAIPCGIILCIVFSAALSKLVPWFLNKFIKPVDIEAATTRAYDILLFEQGRFELARADWLLGQSFEPWKRADGPTFEKLTARAFRRQGWKVQMVGGANDGGVDLRIRNGDLLVVVQCKAYARPVTPSTVRELYGAMQHEKAGGAIMVCLSGATKAANAWVKDKPLLIITPEQLIQAEGFKFTNRV